MSLKLHKISPEIFAIEGVMAGTHDGFAYGLDNGYYSAESTSIATQVEAQVSDVETPTEHLKSVKIAESAPYVGATVISIVDRQKVA